MYSNTTKNQVQFDRIELTGHDLGSKFYEKVNIFFFFGVHLLSNLNATNNRIASLS